MNTTNPYLPPPTSTTTQPTRPSTLTLLPPSSTSSLLPTPTPTFSSLFNNTSTTPIVITPNTLKTIEQSILQTLGEDPQESFLMESQQYSGNFVPPLPSNTNTITLINTWQGGQVSSECNGEEPKSAEVDMEEVDIKPKLQEISVKEESVNGKKKRGSVKKAPAPRAPRQQQKKTPAPSQPKPRAASKAQKSGNSRETEEDERRRIRRERNKLAAARCRKRRVDHTNKLQEETEGLESKKRALQLQITELQSQKEELEFVLEAHNCVKRVIKNEVLADLQNLPRVSEAGGGANGGKLKRPTSLNVTASEAPIPISTPSTGIAGLGFDSIMCSELGVTGYTPIEDANVPDSGKGSLVTPVNPYANPFKKLQDL